MTTWARARPCGPRRAATAEPGRAGAALNDGYSYHEKISTRAVGLRVDHYLSQSYRHSSLDEWRARIRAGRVLVDGACTRADALLRLGQRLTWHRAPWIEPEAPLGLEVLYDEGGVLVVHKPAGLPTQAGGGFLQHSLVHQLLLHQDGAAPVHRLGRWTSGAVLCSRSRAVGASLAAQLGARTIDKRYRALATGCPDRGRFDVRTRIGPVPYPPLGTLHAACPDGRRAESQVTVLEQRAGAFLCDVRIATGRPHQIRIHLAAAGHPLVGDPLYTVGGRPGPDGRALPGDGGYHLHAAQIGFDHPCTGQRVVIDAPPPALLVLGPARSASQPAIVGP